LTSAMPLIADRKRTSRDFRVRPIAVVVKTKSHSTEAALLDPRLLQDGKTDNRGRTNKSGN